MGWNPFKDAKKVAQKLGNVIDDIGDAAKDIVDGGADIVRNSTKAAWEVAEGSVKAAGQAATGNFKGAFNTLVDTTKGSVKDVVEIAKIGGDTAIGSMKSMTSAAVETTKAATGFLIETNHKLAEKTTELTIEGTKKITEKAIDLTKEVTENTIEGNKKLVKGAVELTKKVTENTLNGPIGEPKGTGKGFSAIIKDVVAEAKSNAAAAETTSKYDPSKFGYNSPAATASSLDTSKIQDPAVAPESVKPLSASQIEINRIEKEYGIDLTAKQETSITTTFDVKRRDDALAKANDASLSIEDRAAQLKTAIEAQEYVSSNYDVRTNGYTGQKEYVSKENPYVASERAQPRQTSGSSLFNNMASKLSVDADDFSVASNTAETKTETKSDLKSILGISHAKFDELLKQNSLAKAETSLGGQEATQDNVRVQVNIGADQNALESGTRAV